MPRGCEEVLGDAPHNSLPQLLGIVFQTCTRKCSHDRNVEGLDRSSIGNLLLFNALTLTLMPLTFEPHEAPEPHDPKPHASYQTECMQVEEAGVQLAPVVVLLSCNTHQMCGDLCVLHCLLGSNGGDDVRPGSWAHQARVVWLLLP